jgi:hypothetical protein
MPAPLQGADVVTLEGELVQAADVLELAGQDTPKECRAFLLRNVSHMPKVRH